MGIVADLRPIAADELAALRREPETVSEWIDADAAERGDAVLQWED